MKNIRAFQTVTLTLLGLFLYPIESIGRPGEPQNYPHAYYRGYKGGEGPSLQSVGRQKSTRLSEGKYYKLFRVTGDKCGKKYTVQIKGYSRARYCLSSTEWKKLKLTYTKISPVDQVDAIKETLEQLKELTEIGVYSSAEKGTRLRGPYRPTEGSYQVIAKTTTLEKWSSVYRIPHRRPCNETTEHTVQRLTQYKTNPLRYNKDYYCINKKVLYSLSSGQELWINAYQTAIEASKKAIRERARKKREETLSKKDFSEWYQPGELPPQGYYFSCQHYCGVRGRFGAVYEKGERNGYIKLDDRYQVGSKVFVIPNQPPCDPKTEYTVKVKGEDGYFCADQAEFHKAVTKIDSLMALSDVVYCDTETQQRISAIYKKQELAEQKALEEFGATGKAVRSIDVFQHLPNESGPLLRVYETDIDDCPGCYLVKYFGPLYGACGGFCKVQGYTILIGGDGKVVRFLQSSLIIFVDKTRTELVIPKEGLNTILSFVNRKKSSSAFKGIGLEDFFKKLDEEKILANTSDYSARWSKETKLWGAGNTVGSFVLHIGFVRKELKLGDWPQYDWSKIQK